VAGTSPNKAGETVHGVPVYSSIADIQSDHQVDASVIFVPAKFAKAAAFEAIDAGIKLIVIISEGIPVHDMLSIYQHKQGSGSVVIGPNCPGVLLPGVHSLGIIPARLSTPGDTAVVSRSGTLTYEAMDGLTRRGFGQKYIIGIGGDRISGSSFTDCLDLFERDVDVKRIVLIGEIGGTAEVQAAEFIRKSLTKPVYAYVAGHTAPAGVQLGHAGAILGTNQLETATAKTELLSQSGAVTASSLSALLDTMV
jgi:succinyl-CoA synthetase alpha subunit